MVSQVRRSVQLPGPGPKATLAGLPPVWWSGHPTWLLPALAWHQVLNTPPQNAPPAPTTLPTTGVHLPGWSLGFVTEQLTRSIPLEEKQLEPSYFSLSVAPQALGVFTLNSRPAERIYNLIMEF